MAAAKATLDTVKNKIEEGNSENTKWYDEERSRQAARDAILANASAVTGGWLGKIFGGQNKARMEAAEAERERLRREKGGPSGGVFDGIGAGLKGGKGGILGKGLKGLFSIFGALIKGPFKMLGWIARIPLMLASVTALWAGLAAVVGFFAAVTVASMTMSQKDFDKLKLDIANGVAGVIQKVVDGAMEIWNSFVPDSWKISEADKKAFSNATFTAVSETIVATIEFVEGISKAFNKGFQEDIEGFGESWQAFKTVFDKIIKVFEGSTEGAGDAVEGGLKVAAEKVGKAIVSIGKFFLDLATALGSEALGEKADTDNKFVNTAAHIIVSIIKFIKDIAVSFGEGFATKFDGIAESFGTLKTKIGLVFDKVGGLIKDIGEKGTGESRSTIMGVFTMLGSALGSVIEGVLDVFTFLADLILDPTVTLAKAQVGIEDAFQSMGRNIADFFDEMFNMESLMKMFQGILGKDSVAFSTLEWAMGTTVEEAAADRQKEIKAESDRMKQKNKILAVSAKETDKQLKAELALGDKRDDEKVRNLTLMLAREQADIERNEAAIKRADESIKASKEIIIQEKVDAAMGEEARKQERANEKLKKEIRGIEFRQANLATGMGRIADVSGVNERITGKAWESMLAAVQKTMGPDVTAEQLAGGQVKLSAEAVNEILRSNSNFARDNLDNMEDQAIMFKAGLSLQKETAANQLKIDKRKEKLAGTEVALAKKRKDIETKIRKQEVLPAKAKPLAIKPSKVVTDTVEAVKETVKPTKSKTIPAVMTSQSYKPKDLTMYQGEKGSWSSVGGEWIFYSDRTVQKRQQGGLVTETGLAMLHGTVPKPELILDNQAAALFMEAALVLKGIGLGSGVNLMDLQRESSAVQQTGGGMVNIVNNSPQQVNQNQAMVLPPSPISPFNSDSPRLLN
jgi:hypothetical protein